MLTRDSKAMIAALCLTFTPAAPANAQAAGDIAKAPLSQMLQAAVLEGVRAQIRDSANARVEPMLHFPPYRGDNGRVCGEVAEQTRDGEKIRAFYATYTRSGRVLVRLEEMRLSDYLEQDKVFRNCGPRL
jgi:hypothetical protein